MLKFNENIKLIVHQIYLNREIILILTFFKKYKAARVDNYRAN